MFEAERPLQVFNIMSSACLMTETLHPSERSMGPVAEPNSYIFTVTGSRKRPCLCAVVPRLSIGVSRCHVRVQKSRGHFRNQSSENDVERVIETRHAKSGRFRRMFHCCQSAISCLMTSKDRHGFWQSYTFSRTFRCHFRSKTDPEFEMHGLSPSVRSDRIETINPAAWSRSFWFLQVLICPSIVPECLSTRRTHNNTCDAMR